MKKVWTYLLLISSAAVCASYGPISASNAINKGEPAPIIKYPVFDPIDTTSYEMRKKRHQLDSLFRSKVRNEGFNGTVLIAKQGTILYEAAFGYADYYAKDTLTPNSSFQLASISKTLTSGAVLKLKEQGKLSLDDSVQRFIPLFPYKGITIRHLLNHRSGLPNYLYFGTKWSPGKNVLLTNSYVIEMMREHKPGILFAPNSRFQYSNTNYLVLAYIVEQASGMSFKDYMYFNIFQPLDMRNSWVFDFTYGQHPGRTFGYKAGWKIDEFTPFDGVVGDKGIYSSVEDMFKWDQALYTGKILSEATLREAFTPYSFENPGKKNYGLGWRLIQQPDNSYMPYHNGWWHSYNTAFYRIQQDKSTIIVLSNKYNRGVYNVQPIWNILYGAFGMEGYLKADEPDE